MATGGNAGLKVGEVATRLGTTTRTVRFYEEVGLLQAGRSAGGTRRYSERDVGRLEAILDLAAAGIPLERIRELARARAGQDHGSEASRAVVALLEQLEADCTARIEQLRETRRQLQAARELVSECRACQRRPDSRHCPGCPVKRARDRQPLASLIWDQEDEP